MWMQARECVNWRAVAGGSFAADELVFGLQRLYGKDNGQRIEFKFEIDKTLPVQGYRINGCLVQGADESGLLYGVYALLAQLRMGKVLDDIELESSPAVKSRLLNHWDNMSGIVERGYSGRSLFFSDNRISYDADRIKDYARLLASVGINELSINNVNVTPLSAKLITDEFLPDVANLAEIFRPFGIRLILAADFESPVKLGGLPTADPLDEAVINWWNGAAEEVYRYIPDLAGFVIKADSEFRDGPAALGRTQADGANVLARALKKYGGTVYWRCFVYNCKQDWRDTKTDRPMAAYAHFSPLDGQFDDNVVLQIKNGPVDFQVREPNSPLFGSMKRTRQAIEFQVTQEYTGQQIDMYNLAVQWEEVFNTPVSKTRLTRDLMGKEIVAAAAVSNVGSDNNWTGHLLAQANLYAYGRMAWDSLQTARKITLEWVSQTFGSDAVSAPLTEMLLESRNVYEKYTAPLGIGWMVNINHHYGPSVDGYEYMKWGTYHRADNAAIGVDRTDRGTGFTEQYDPWLANLYNNIETCPEELLLFFHRVRYDYILKSGKTLIQHIYDTHFEGVEDVDGFRKTWDSLRQHLPPDAYEQVAGRLKRQMENACEWRDVINSYFYRKTGINDEKGRKIYV
jgi:alpha-glucuronidase